MKYEPTDVQCPDEAVVPMQRPTATYTWAVVGGELATPPGTGWLKTSLSFRSGGGSILSSGLTTIWVGAPFTYYPSLTKHPKNHNIVSEMD